MKNIIKGSLLSLALAAPFAASADSVVVNNVTYTCTNTCVVSSHNGNTTVSDCCGGQVSGRFQVPSRIEE